MMIQPLLQAISLSRRFGQFEAVHSLDFSINPGEITILAGPNGAGKTTLLLCLCGLLRPTTGNVLVEGYDLYHDEREAKKRLAYVPDVPHFYQELTSWEHLHFICMAYSVEENWQSRGEKLFKEFGLWSARDMYPHNLSRGMRLKLGISLAMVRPFKVLILDEPTSALDQDSVQVLSTKLLSLKASGCAILLSSHDPSMVDVLGGKRLVMDRGHLEETG
jgi:ABC-2 type transport system ATP-binding protein